MPPKGRQMTLFKSSALIVAFWLWLALLPAYWSIFTYRSVRDQIVTREWPMLYQAHYAAVAITSLIALLAIPQPLAVA